MQGGCGAFWSRVARPDWKWPCIFCVWVCLCMAGVCRNTCMLWMGVYGYEHVCIWVFMFLSAGSLFSRWEVVVCGCFGFSGKWQALCLYTLCLVGTHILIRWCLGYLAYGGVGSMPSQIIHSLQQWVFALMPLEQDWDCRWHGDPCVYFILQESLDVVATSVCCLNWCGEVTESQSLKLLHPLADLHT